MIDKIDEVPFLLLIDRGFIFASLLSMHLETLEYRVEFSIYNKVFKEFDV